MSASQAELRGRIRPVLVAVGLVLAAARPIPGVAQTTAGDDPLDILAPEADGPDASGNERGAGGGAAQIPGPVGPIPPAPQAGENGGDPGPASITAEPVSGGSVTAGEGATESPDSRSNVLSVESLGETAAGWQGPLDPADGGLGAELWRGTPATLVLRLLDDLDGNSMPTGAGPLLQRLLLSNSRPPAGVVPADSERAGVAPERLQLARLDKLITLGALDGAGDLLEGLDTRESAAIKRRRAERQLLAGNLEQACALTAGDSDGRDAPFWAKLRIVCNIADGARARAELSRDVLAESGHTAPRFFTLADPLIVGDAPDPTALGGIDAGWSPITVALLRLSDVEIDVAAETMAQPGILAALARSGRLTTASELRVAERAVVSRAMPATALARRYGTLAFDRQALDSLLADAEGRQAGIGAEEAARLAGHDPNGPRRRALLFRGAQIELAAGPRAEILRLGIIDTRRSGHLALFARVIEPLLDDVAPSEDLGWFAPHAARAYLALGRPGRAAAWLNVGAESDAAARADLAPLRPMAGNGASDLPTAHDLGLADWQAGLLNRAAPRATTLRARSDSPFADKAAELGRGEAYQRLRLASTLHDGLGASVPAAIWQHLAAARDGRSSTATAALPPARATAWQALRRAARNGRRGETVLLALTVLGGDDAASLPPPLVADSLAALRAVGADGAARTVARESALAAGL